MSRVDDNVQIEIAVRWDGNDYTRTEFLPDQPDSLGDLQKDYRTIAEMAENARAVLAGARPAGWTGGAAEAYRTYLTGVGDYLATISDATHTAALAARTCQSALQEAIGEAERAATRCNEARATHRTAEDKLFFDPRRTWELIQANDQMSDGIGMARGARQRARDAYTAFIGALDPADNALATQDEPALPGAADVHDPENAALLAMIMAPVAAAVSATGDTARARSTAAAYEQAMKDDPTGREARDLLARAARDLSGPELDHLLTHLDETDLATALGNLDPTRDREIYNLLAAKASLPVLARLADTDPNHYWHPANGTDRFIWGDTDGTPGVNPSGGLDDLHQGMLGDCYYLASLGALVRSDPDFLSDHVRPNANGAYTVTLYEDGKPVEVTVTPEVPWTASSDGSPGSPAYSHDDDGTGWNGDRTLFQIYEKAMAQSHGELAPEPGAGYGGMNGGNASNYLPTLTGQDADWKGADDVSPGDMQSAVEGQRPVVVSTLGEDDAEGKDLYDPKRVPHLIAGHAYYVDSVNTSTDPPTVTVVNPWGRESGSDGTVTLTWEQFQQMTAGASIGK